MKKNVVLSSEDMELIVEALKRIDSGAVFGALSNVQSLAIQQRISQIITKFNVEE